MSSASSAVLMRLDATTGTETAARTRAAALRHAPPWHRIGNGRHAGLVPANASVDDVGAGSLDLASKGGDLIRRCATLDQIGSRNTIDDQ